MEGINKGEGVKKEDVMNALLAYAAAQKEFDKENGYTISSTPLTHGTEKDLIDNPELKKGLEEDHSSKVLKLQEEVESLKKEYEEKLKESGLSEEDEDIKKINSDVNYWK